MVSDRLNLERSTFIQADYLHAHPQPSAPDFGVDLADPGVTERIQPQTGKVGANVFEFGSSEIASNHPFIAPEVPNNQVQIEDNGPIQSVSLPSGWSELTAPAPQPGVSVFQPVRNTRLADGKWFVPPAGDGDSSVEMHVGPGLEPAPPATEAAFRRALSSPPHDLTPAEFQAVAGIIAPFDGGNNQFQDMGSLFPKFAVTSAAIVDVNGRNGLLVKGTFSEGAHAGQARESLYFDDRKKPGGIEQINITAPPGKMQQYEVPFWNTVRTIRFSD